MGYGAGSPVPSLFFNKLGSFLLSFFEASCFFTKFNYSEPAMVSGSQTTKRELPCRRHLDEDFFSFQPNPVECNQVNMDTTDTEEKNQSGVSQPIKLQKLITCHYKLPL